MIKLTLHLILFSLFACTGDGQKYEYIEKNELFRHTIKTGHFVELSQGFTYYEFDDLKNNNLIVFVHGFSSNDHRAADPRSFDSRSYCQMTTEPPTLGHLTVGPTFK